MNPPVGKWSPETLRIRRECRRDMDPDELADTLAVEQTMSKYSLFWDRERADDLVELFAPDCLAEYPARTCDGRQAVREYVEEYFAGETQIQDSFHVTANPWVAVDGDAADGRWHFLGAYTLRDVGAAWVMGFYDNTFTRDGGSWRIDHLQFEPKYVAPYDAGWAEQPFPG
jgi:hypothetical protein